MAFTPSDFPSRSWPRRLLKVFLWAIGIVLVLVLLLGVLVGLVPTLASTGYVREQVQTRASRAMHRPVGIQDLYWTWGEGLSLQGLTVADDPALSQEPLLTLDRLQLVVGWRDLWARRVRVDLEVSDARVNLIREESGRTNLEALLLGLKTEPAPEPEPKPEKAPIPPLGILPRDVSVSVLFKDLLLHVEDRMQGNNLLIHEANLAFKAPSLLSEPVTLQISTLNELDGRPLPPLSLHAHVATPFVPGWGMDLEKLALDMQASFSGVELSLAGGLKEKGLSGELAMDLAKLLEAAGPLAPPNLPTVWGTMDLTFQASLDPQKVISFETALRGNDLTAEGGPLEERRVGPVNLMVRHKGAFDQIQKRVEILSGDLQVQEQTGLAWKGVVQLSENGPLHGAVTLTSVRVHGGEVLELARPFLPPDMGLSIPSGETGDFFGLHVHEIQVDLEHPSLKGLVDLRQVELKAPGIGVPVPGGRLEVGDIHLELPLVQIQMEAAFPSRLDMSARATIGPVQVTGDHPVELEQLIMDSFRLSAKDLARDERAFLGVSGTLGLDQSMAVQKLDAKGHGFLPGLTQGLSLEVRLPSAPELLIPSAEMSMALDGLLVRHPQTLKLEEKTRAGARLKGWKLTRSKDLSVDGDRLDLSLEAGDLLHCRVEGRVEETGNRNLTIRGELKLDLKRAAGLVPQLAEKAHGLSGRLYMDWDLEGRRPNEEELKALLARDAPVGDRMDHLRFVRKLECSANLEGLAARIALSDQASLDFKGLHTPERLRIILRNGLEYAALEGFVRMDQILEMPGLGRPKEPLGLGFSFSIQQEGLRSLKARQGLEIPSLHLSQEFSLVLDRLDRLLEGHAALLPGVILSRISGSGSARIRGDLGSPLLALAQTPFAGSGAFEAGLTASLRGGEELRGRAWMETSGMTVQTGQGARVQDLKGRLDLSRTFRIFTHTKDPTPSARELSSQVLAPGRTRLSDLSLSTSSRGPSLSAIPSGPPSLSFEAVRLPAMPLPVSLENGHIWLGLDSPLPTVKRFQMDVLGGSLAGSLAIVTRPAPFSLTLDAAFSGIDTTRLIQGVEPGPGQSPMGAMDTEISGQMLLQCPLVQDPSRLLGDLNASIRLTHIGSRTLERLLYALDPYESNEALVRQRNLLKSGTPRGILMEIGHGQLSLSGHVEVKGIRIALPRIDRLNLTALPLGRDLDTIGMAVGRVIPLLQALSANAVLVDEKDQMHLMEWKQ